MKKLSLLIMLVLVASLLVAAIPTKMVRLTVINKSGYDVFIKLEGSKLTEAFYYLTIPAGTQDVPTVKIFTILVDYYTRTTWQCNGLQSSGNLFVDGNLRLTFIPCGAKPCEWWTIRQCTWRTHDKGCEYQHCSPLNDPNKWYLWTLHRHAGEPRMEKVTYWKYVSMYPTWGLFDYWGWPLNIGWGFWHGIYNKTNFWFYACQTWAWRIRTYQLPVGCAWRYQY